MQYEILKTLYHTFYSPQAHTAEKAEIDACHAALSNTLEISERKLLLKLLDAEDCIRDAETLRSFIAGFRLAWKLSAELNTDMDEHSDFAPEGAEESARFFSGTEAE